MPKELVEVTPRGVFAEPTPRTYRAINGPRFGTSLPVAPQHGETPMNPLVASKRETLPPPRMPYVLFANEVGIENSVKVVPLPVRIPAELSAGAITEMQQLGETGVLTALRGGRRTDLPRPLPAEVREQVIEGSPHLVELITRVESAIKGSDLFIRAVKLDKARASTTQAAADVAKSNFHYDAERSSKEAYPGPVYQYYANVAQEPRQFRIVPLTYHEMGQALQRSGLITEAEIDTLPMETLLNTFMTNFDVPIEDIVVESGRLAIFDGRTFAHDAGKAKVDELQQGRFVPTEEPDFLLALDTIKTGHHVGLYHPEMSLLDDPGTDAWWDMMKQFKGE
jgi:hypothetical protein